MCRTQNICTGFFVVHPLSHFEYTLLIDLCLSEIKHRPCYGVICLFRFRRKNNHVPAYSLSTTAKAIKKILLFSSCATATRRVPLYLLYNNIEIHRYMVWNSKKDDGTWRNPLLVDLFVVALQCFPSSPPYQEEIDA